jgi:hypothetical protein
MGRQVDLNKPLSQEDKNYLVERGRGYLIATNERRFGVDGTRVPEPHEALGAPSQTPFYSTPTQQFAVYDKGGAPLPGTVLDYDTGRLADRENGLLVEYSGPGHTPGAYNLDETFVREEGFDSQPDDDDIDDDIVKFVTGLKTKGDVQKKLTDIGKSFETDANRGQLDENLAIALQDLRDAGQQIDLS